MNKNDSASSLTISFIAGIAAFSVFLIASLTYLYFGYQKEVTAAQNKADLYASLVHADFADKQGAHKPTRQIMISRLIELMEIEPLRCEQEIHRIFDQKNSLIAETRKILTGPLVKRAAEIKNSETPFARMEITRSLRPLLTNIALVVLLGALLCRRIFLALRIFPMHAISLVANEIRVRQQTEADLQQSLTTLKAILESTADGILVLDRLGRITSFNDQFIKMWQIPKDIIASLDNNLILAAITKQLSEPRWFLEKIRQLRETTPQSDDAGPEIIGLTEGLAFELTSKPQWIGNQSAGWVWSFHDITERKRTEAILSGEKHVLEQIVGGASLPKVLEILVHSIESKSRRMFCTIMLSDDKERLQYTGGYGISNDFLSTAKRLVIPATACALNSSTGKVFAISDMSSDSVWADYRDLALRHGLQACWAAPIHSSTGDVLGLVATYYREHDTPDPHDLGLVEIACNLSRIVIERKQAEAQLDFLARYDSLTGLPNRLLFRDRLTHAIARADRYNQMLALMFIDLDRFKIINDTLGHDIGDLLLVKVAERIKACIREEDTAARLGGDEFTVILEQIIAPEDASSVAQKIIDELSLPFDLHDNESFITASIGISIYPTDITDMEGLLKNTDVAMYNAKETGRNNFQFYAKEMNFKAISRLELENRLGCYFRSRPTAEEP